MSLQTAAIRTPEDGSYTVVSNSWLYPDIPVTTLHLSCASDVYDGTSRSYAGVILYAHNGQTEWTLNGKRCKTGYIVVQDPDTPAVKRYRGTSEGVVHGAVYKNVFGEDIGDTVGEGFSIMNGEFKWRSWTFNARTKHYHDGSKQISAVAKDCIFKILLVWMKIGKQQHCLPCTRNYNVEDIYMKCTCQYN